MSEGSRSSVPPWVRAGIGLLFVVVFVTALIRGQLLLGVIGCTLIGGGYFMWRILAAVEAIADALDRLAEREKRE